MNPAVITQSTTSHVSQDWPRNCSVLLSISNVSWTCTHVRSARGHVLVRARPALARVLLHVMVLLRVLLARLL